MKSRPLKDQSERVRCLCHIAIYFISTYLAVSYPMLSYLILSDRVKSLYHGFSSSCDTVAIGNGVGCRECESLVSQMIKENAFSPLDVVYW